MKPMKETYELNRNDERYPPNVRQLDMKPKIIIISGTRLQAEHIAWLLSLSEPGCDNYYLITRRVK